MANASCADCFNAKCPNAESRYAECRHYKYPYAECHYTVVILNVDAECHYTVAILSVVILSAVIQRLVMQSVELLNFYPDCH